MARMTNAMLSAENERLRAHCNVIETQLASLQAEHEALRARVVMPTAQAPARSDKPQPEDYPIYWNYVRACRAWHQARSIRVVSYVSREDWADAIAYAQGATAGY